MHSRGSYEKLWMSICRDFYMCARMQLGIGFVDGCLSGLSIWVYSAKELTAKNMVGSINGTI